MCTLDWKKVLMFLSTRQFIIAMAMHVDGMSLKTRDSFDRNLTLGRLLGPV